MTKPNRKTPEKYSRVYAQGRALLLRGGGGLVLDLGFEGWGFMTMLDVRRNGKERKDGLWYLTSAGSMARTIAQRKRD
jgi:hypothetical protein